MTENNHIIEIHPAPEGLNESARLTRELAISRVKVALVRAQIEKAEQDLKKLKSYQAIGVLKDGLTTLQTEQMEIEGNLRTTALDVAVELKMKNPAPGITITKKTTFTIDDESVALDSCRDSYPQLIEEKIKKAELRKIVVALGEAIKGTTLVEEEYGQVKISIKLDEHYLTDAASENDVPF